jgi:hypothetical protein
MAEVERSSQTHIGKENSLTLSVDPRLLHLVIEMLATLTVLALTINQFKLDIMHAVALFTFAIIGAVCTATFYFWLGCQGEHGAWIGFALWLGIAVTTYQTMKLRIKGK